MNEEILNNIEGDLQNIPQEVQEFIFGDPMKNVIDEIGAILGQNSEQKDHIKNDIIFFLLGISSSEDIVKYIDSLIITTDIKDTIKTIIQEKIFDELQLLMEVHQDMENTGYTSPTTAPTPSDILSRLNQTLVRPTTLAPTKRDLSMGSVSPSTEAPAKDSGKIDPYREIPEK